MLNLSHLAQAVKRAAAECGYLACGITDAAPFENYAAALCCRKHRFPSARQLYAEMETRIDPRRTAPWTQAVIVGVRRYGKYQIPAGLGRHIGRSYLADRRLPACPDHMLPKLMTARLRELGLRVRRGGTPERAAGARAGVISIGRNGFAYHPEAGSWINLESWRVDAPLPPDPPDLTCPCPADCRKCINACPTGALSEPFTVRIDHCIAYLTYSAPRPISDDLWEKMGPWIYGCDSCQLPCPLNHGRWQETEPMPWLEPIKDLLSPAALATMNETVYRQYIHPLFWYIPPTGLERWRANAARALRQAAEFPSGP